jgi:predicted negative regulator of RcsB-dependent stress response
VDELSEREQWDNLKGWLRSNGPQVLIMVAVMLLGFYGWKWWQARGDEQAQAASAAYQAIIARFDDIQYIEGEALIESLRQNHPDSPYVDAADMVAARVFVENNQLDKAAARLERVAGNAQDKRLRAIAKIRLARVQAAQGKYDTALATLGTASMGVQEAARLEARGDVLLQKGDRAAALADYQAARELQPGLGDAAGGNDPNELLDLKIADLKYSAAPTSAAPASLARPEPAVEVVKP